MLSVAGWARPPTGWDTLTKMTYDVCPGSPGWAAPVNGPMSDLTWRGSPLASCTPCTPTWARYGAQIQSRLQTHGSSNLLQSTPLFLQPTSTFFKLIYWKCSQTWFAKFSAHIKWWDWQKLHFGHQITDWENKTLLFGFLERQFTSSFSSHHAKRMKQSHLESLKLMSVKTSRALHLQIIHKCTSL